MNIQGSNISGSYNSTSKQDTVVKKSEDRAQGQRTLSNNVKITNTKSSTKKRIDDNFGQSKYVTYSENLKRQSKSFSAAAGNASDGASLIQTATDALNETEAILNRMKEISDQAVESSLSSNDRQVLQQELDNLSASINDISKNTNANGINIFDGDGSTKVNKPSPAYESIDQIIIKREFIEESFAVKDGTNLYAENGIEALSKEDAVKTLQNGGNLYTNAATAQTAFDYDKWKTDNPASGSDNVGSLDNTVAFTEGNNEFGATYYIKIDDPNTVRLSKIGFANTSGVRESIVPASGDSLKSHDYTLSEFVDKANAYTRLQDKFTFDKYENGDSSYLVIKAKENYKLSELKITNTAISEDKISISNGSSPSGGGALQQAALPTLYEKNSTEALSNDAAKEKLAAGETLYTDAHTAQTLAKKDDDYSYTPSKTVLREEVIPGKKDNSKEKPLATSYKTLNFQLNAEGSKYVSARIDRMDSDALGVTNLSIRNAKEAEMTSQQIDEAKTQVKNQREYLSSIGGRLKEAATVNDKNAGYVKDAQKQDAAKNPVTVEPKEDIYAALQQTVLENANKASEDAINLIGSTEIAQPTKE